MFARIVLTAAVLGAAAPAFAQTATPVAPQPVATAPTAPSTPIATETAGGKSGCGWSSAMAPIS